MAWKECVIYDTSSSNRVTVYVDYITKEDPSFKDNCNIHVLKIIILQFKNDLDHTANSIKASNILKIVSLKSIHIISKIAK